MKQYKALDQQIWREGMYSIVPIRVEDRYLIMKWRNEQIYHLRQNAPLTKKSQDSYFKNVVEPLFDLKEPNQLLFSFLRNDQPIGYGGLVHINRIDSHAEISFVIDTSLEADEFQELWFVYLRLIEKVAFEDLKLHKIFTYAFDIRPKLYPVLQKSDFQLDARLKDHCRFDGKFLDVVIHSKINPLEK